MSTVDMMQNYKTPDTSFKPKYLRHFKKMFFENKECNFDLDFLILDYTLCLYQAEKWSKIMYNWKFKHEKFDKNENCTWFDIRCFLSTGIRKFGKIMENWNHFKNVIEKLIANFSKNLKIWKNDLNFNLILPERRIIISS